MDPFPLLLTVLLAAPTCHVRNAAEQALSAQGLAAYPVLVAAARSTDPERRYRAQRMLAQLPPSDTLAWLDWSGPAPWIDSMPMDYPDRSALMNEFRNQACEVTQDAPTYLRDRAAGRLFLRWLVGQGRPSEARRLLPLMRARCGLWDYGRCRYADERTLPMDDP